MQINSLNYGTNFGLNFGAKKSNQNVEYIKVPKGADYEVLDTLDLRRDKTIPQLSESLKSGEDISADRDKLILQRVKTAIKDAKKFLTNNPQLGENNALYSHDDLVQELACQAIEGTDRELSQNCTTPYGVRYAHDRDYHFQKIEQKTNLRPEAEAKFHGADYVPTVEDEVMPKALKEQLDKALDTLTKREKGVLTARFGLTDGKQRTLEEVGKAFNVTRDRVRQIEAKALRKLRHPARAKELKAFIR